jgi:hypothetical protein
MRDGEPAVREVGLQQTLDRDRGAEVGRSGLKGLAGTFELLPPRTAIVFSPAKSSHRRQSSERGRVCNIGTREKSSGPPCSRCGDATATVTIGIRGRTTRPA